MPSISSIPELVNALNDCDQRDFPRIAPSIDIPKEEFEKFATWDEDHYTRNCIANNDDYELLLLCWDEGQETPIHCHGGKECWVRVIAGPITEKRFEEDDFNPDKPDEVEKCKSGDITYMNDDLGFHSLHNEGSGRAMSLHLYVDPIKSCRIYDPEKGEFEMTELEYDTSTKYCMAEADETIRR